MVFTIANEMVNHYGKKLDREVIDEITRNLSLEMCQGPTAWAFSGKNQPGTCQQPQPDVVVAEFDRVTAERDALQQRLNAADQLNDDRAGTCEWSREDDSGIWNSGCGETWSFHEDGPEENGMHFCHSCGKHLMVEVVEQEQDDDWHMNPCKQGHRDIGAAGGVAACNQCDEKIEAATTQEAFERWNATHPASESTESR